MRRTTWSAMCAGAAFCATLMGCGIEPTPVDTLGSDAGTSGDDVPEVTDQGTVPAVDAGSPVLPMDAGRPPGPVDAGTPPRDTGVFAPRDTGVVAPRDTGPVAPRDTGVGGVDAALTGLCSDPVPATTTGPQINLETLEFNWSMQCYRPEDGSLFVFVEDTERRGVALRFYDFLNNGGPATGQTVDLSTARLAQRPFFVSGLSGIQTEPTWRAERSYLAYEGQAVFHQLQRTNPVGTPMRVEFRNVRLREVRQYTNGRCENVPNGARMFVRSLMLNLRVNNIHTDQDCIDWAGG